MKKEKLAIIHTVSSLVSTFKSLCEELLPGIETYHVVDESLLKDAIRDGRVTPLNARRLLDYCVHAEQAGAKAVLVSCSSMGTVAERSRAFIGVPVFRVDQAMIEQAVHVATRIGVFATLITTLEPTVSMLKTVAQECRKQVALTVKCCEGPFEALTRGDTDGHDRIVASAIREAAAQSEVIVLAQASMTRVIPQLNGLEKKIPILTSPRVAVEYLAQRIFKPETMPDGTRSAVSGGTIGAAKG